MSESRVCAICGLPTYPIASGMDHAWCLRLDEPIDDIRTSDPRHAECDVMMHPYVSPERAHAAMYLGNVPSEEGEDMVG